MGITVKARYSKGVIEPLEKLDLEEGKEVNVTINEVPLEEAENAFLKSAGGWKGTIDADKLIKDIYSSRLISTRRLPKL
jgi:predicted DNA-binding antitoxin AbrB/MazE fold protein